MSVPAYTLFVIKGRLHGYTSLAESELLGYAPKVHHDGNLVSPDGRHLAQDWKQPRLTEEDLNAIASLDRCDPTLPH